jgi:putative transposase
VKAYAFVEREKAYHSVRALCRVLGVSPSGYWAWRRRQPAGRERADAQLSARIRNIHQESRGTYGAPRIHAELAATGTGCGRKRVARLMRRAGLVGCQRRRACRTTQRDPTTEPAPDLVQRAFTAAAPARLWVADLTYVPTGDGVLSRAVILDVFSRRVVGWSMAAPRRAEIVVSALEMAVITRRPAAGLIHHSDHGSQYTSLTFGDHCRSAGIRQSMGSVGDCFDNALAESFFATLECELLTTRSFRTHAEARTALFSSSEGFDNRRRRHSALGYLAPESFERRYTQQHVAYCFPLHESGAAPWHALPRGHTAPGCSPPPSHSANPVQPAPLYVRAGLAGISAGRALVAAQRYHARAPGSPRPRAKARASG